MKTLPATLPLAVMLGLALPAAAGTGVDSIYTSLKAEDCKTLEFHEDEGGWYAGRCAGVAGYQLDLLEDDLRQSLTVIDPKGREFALDFWTIVSGGFSAVGQKAEWRVPKDGDKITPFALIVRFNVSEDPEQPHKTTSYLVVSKIDPMKARRGLPSGVVVNKPDGENLK